MPCALTALRQKKRVQAHFLLGPAGSGKTFRCLAEIRDALRQNPDGPPLIVLAPKQATFQLERQLLADGDLAGYTRLHIFSFERLAHFVLAAAGVPPPAGMLADEGRTMVLRALLLRHTGELELFGSSARRPGFAQQLGQSLDELRQHRCTPARLRALAHNDDLGPELRHKLLDLARLLEAYVDWLEEHELQDASRLLEMATNALRGQAAFRSRAAAEAGEPAIEGLWLDGFAEMTPQELDLLAGILPHCERATLAFCLSAEPGAETSWLSLWSSVAKTFQQCRERLARLPNVDLQVERLEPNARPSRFAANPMLQRLEREWPRPAQKPEPEPPASLRVIECADAVGEAIFAAREILKFVRPPGRGNRFRDCAVLVRNLDSHYQPLARVFRRYGVPFFLDRRESVAHHPLAELTRSALRTVACDWQHDDWFAAIKAGFSPVDEKDIDWLENAALEYGWKGRKWLAPLAVPENPELARSLERGRRQLVPPFENLSGRFAQLQFQPTGTQLAEIIRTLWADLDVEGTLHRWGLADTEDSTVHSPQSAIHATVWDQMNTWVDNVALAFPDEALPLRDWLPVLEAGLAGLTVGVIPPALDQVLVGAIDRARNPDLKLALLLGMNETLFPATPGASAILTDADRAELGEADLRLGPGVREQLARERYLGYIACTRASDQLWVTYARQGMDAKPLNPSPFVAYLRRIFPGLEIERFQGEIKAAEAEHPRELVALLVELFSRSENRDRSVSATRATPAQGLPESVAEAWNGLLRCPAVIPLVEALRALREPELTEGLSPAMAAELFGPTLQSSVSRLEEYAQCPFRFFVHTGLHAEERKVFELDARATGSFQHEVLKVFHERLQAAGKRWCDLTPDRAREDVGRIAAELAPRYRDGLLRADARSEFTARALSAALQDFVETLVTWMRDQYAFDPAAVEMEFGMGPAGPPAWELDLGAGHRLALRGRIDRIDLYPPNRDRAWCVILDYKSGLRRLDPLLMAHGIQLQLLGYLAAVASWPDPRRWLGVSALIPAGAFYVNLRGAYARGTTRDEVLADAEAGRKRAYRHTGRFDAAALPQLDRTGAADQFNYRLNKDGKLWSNSVEALPRPELELLLHNVERQLRNMGEAIFRGAVPVAPYRRGRETPCEFCDYRAACRIDPWTHRYRVLRRPES